MTKRYGVYAVYDLRGRLQGNANSCVHEHCRLRLSPSQRIDNDFNREYSKSVSRSRSVMRVLLKKKKKINK